MGRIVTVLTGTQRTLRGAGQSVQSAYRKHATRARVEIDHDGLVGDDNVWARDHGRTDQDVYAYPRMHYPWWNRTLGANLAHGAFAENLTVIGPSEAHTRIGDRFRAGTAVLEITKPRLPCANMNAAFDDPGMVKAFGQSLRTGYYLRVITPGHVRAGDAFVRVGTDATRPSVRQVAIERLARNTQELR